MKKGCNHKAGASVDLQNQLLVYHPCGCPVTVKSRKKMASFNVIRNFSGEFIKVVGFNKESLQPEKEKQL